MKAPPREEPRPSRSARSSLLAACIPHSSSTHSVRSKPPPKAAAGPAKEKLYLLAVFQGTKASILRTLDSPSGRIRKANGRLLLLQVSGKRRPLSTKMSSSMSSTSSENLSLKSEGSSGSLARSTTRIRLTIPSSTLLTSL